MTSKASSFFLVLSTVTTTLAVPPPRLQHNLVARGEDAQVIAHYSKVGGCFGYFSVKNNEKSFVPCKLWCPKTFPGSNPDMVGCKGPGMAVEDCPDQSIVWKDEEGLLWVGGVCICGPQLELGEVIINIVVNALERLDEVICSAMLSSLEFFATTVLDFIPVTAPAGAALATARVVEGAKTFVENGMSAASFFGDWIGPTCNLPEFHFDIGMVFTNIVGSSDDIGTSKGCFKKSKGDCAKPKEAPPKPSPPKGPQPGPGPTKAPGPEPTKVPEPEPTKVPEPEPTKVPEPNTKVPEPNPTKAPEPKLTKGPEPDPTNGWEPDLTKGPELMPTKGPEPKLSKGPGYSPTKDPEPEPTRGPTTKPDTASALPVTSGPPPSTTARPTTTSRTDSSSEFASACGLIRRTNVRSDGLIEGKLADPMTSVEICNGATTVHSTITEAKIGSYATEVPATCKQAWNQACDHYRSVMSVYEKKGSTDMVRWTCHATPGTSKNGYTTDTWGSTAVGPIAPSHQHWFPWANGFVPRDPGKNGKGCEKDEWPPRAFWPGDTKAKAKGIVQRVRFLPEAENGGAGSMWRQFCEKNVAQITSKGQLLLNTKVIETIRSNSRLDKNGAGGTPTVFTTVSVNTGPAIFTIKDWDGLLNDDFHGLKDNPCWPKLLAPEDPGFALLTDDEFYLEQKPVIIP